MLEFIATLAWPIRSLIFACCGVMLVCLLIGLPTGKHWFWLCTRIHLSPNWLTILRLPVLCLGFPCFYYADRIAAIICPHSSSQLVLIQLTSFLIVVFGCVMDNLDGAAAKALLTFLKVHPEPADISLNRYSPAWAYFTFTELNENGEKVDVERKVIIEPWIIRLTSKHTLVPMFELHCTKKVEKLSTRVKRTESIYYLRLTGLGAVLDPLADKLGLIPPLCLRALQHAYFWQLFPLFVLPEILGTLIRPPFIRLSGIAWLARYVVENKASVLGKLKYILIVGTLLVDQPASVNWLSPESLHLSFLVTSAVFSAATIFAYLSLFSRLSFFPSLLRKIGLKKYFQAYTNQFDNTLVPSKPPSSFPASNHPSTIPRPPQHVTIRHQ